MNDADEKMRVLFLINGLGMGNSTRCFSIIERLAEKGVIVDVMTSGNGLLFFADKLGKEIDRLIETRSLYYAKRKDGKLSVLQTILSMFDFAKIYLANNRLMSQYLQKTKPFLVVTDSEYIFLPMLFRKVPILALNNSDIVVSSFSKFKKKPLSIFPQYFLVECMDYLYHLLAPDKVISPRLKINSVQKNFFEVAPLVRKACRNALFDGEVKYVVIMLSGSAFGSDVNLDGESFPFHIDVIGRTGNNREGVVFHGRVLDNLYLLNRADALAINAGFSAVSEGVFMKKPLVVIPVENHAEQYINARMVEDMGVGIMAKAEEIPSALRRLTSNIETFRSSYRNLGPLQNGGDAACDFIFSFIESCFKTNANEQRNIRK